VKVTRYDPHRTTPRKIYTKKRRKCEPQDNTQHVEIHEEKDQTRNTNAPYPRARLWIAYKTNEKGKRQSEKHEALCEAEHRKTKKNKQTKQPDQQKRKRHRETDTLRADAGKK
jgi:hypothetical protein